MAIKKDDLVRWKQFAKHCVGYYCINVSIEHIRKDIKFGASALCVAINWRGGERTGWTLLTLAFQNPLPEFPDLQWHSWSFKVKGPFCLFYSKGTTFSRRCAVPSILISVNVGVLMERRKLTFSWGSSGKVFQLGIETGSELWFKQPIGVN